MKEKLEYTYQFANGDTVTLTALGSHAKEDGIISRKWIELLNEMDREEYDNDKTESRRHCSLNRRDPAGMLLVDSVHGEQDINETWIRCLFCQVLTEREQVFACWKFIDGYSNREIAELSGLSLRRVQEILQAITKKLRKY